MQQSRLHQIPGVCNSTPHPGSLSPSRAWGYSYLANRHKFPVESRSRGYPEYYTSPGWVPGGGTDGAAPAPALSEGGHWHFVSGGISIWKLFSLGCGYLRFDSSTSRKCSILLPVKPTSARVVFSLDNKCSNVDAPPGTAVTADKRWGIRAMCTYYWSLSLRVPVV